MARVSQSRAHSMLYISVVIHVGISGWRYAPWRGVFYRTDLPQAPRLR